MNTKNGIEPLPITMTMGDEQMVIYPTLIWDKHTAILIDTGMPGQLDDFREAIEQTGVSFKQLDKVIITHQDIDHIGSLPEIVEASEHEIEVIAHELDKPYIEGKKPLMKTGTDSGFPQATVNISVQDGEELPYCGGITVIFTPGHTPGHISLYHKQTKTLITGDALTAAEGKLCKPYAHVTPDMDTAIQSLNKFLAYDIETVICFHGGICTGNIKDQIKQLISK